MAILTQTDSSAEAAQSLINSFIPNGLWICNDVFKWRPSSYKTTSDMVMLFSLFSGQASKHISRSCRLNTHIKDFIWFKWKECVGWDAALYVTEKKICKHVVLCVFCYVYILTEATSTCLPKCHWHDAVKYGKIPRMRGTICFTQERAPLITCKRIAERE